MIITSRMRHRINLRKPEDKMDDIHGYETSYTTVQTVWAEFLKPGFVSKTILGDAAAVEVTQGMRIRTTTIGKGWRVSEGEHEYDVLHVDDTTPGEMILTTTEVQS